MRASEEILITPPELAERLRLSVKTVRRLAATGKIGCVRIGRNGIRFREADVENFLKRAREGKV